VATYFHSLWQDIDCQPRTYNGQVDMGADEWMPGAPVNLSVSPTSGSLAAGAKLTIVCKYSDPDGCDNLANCFLLINTACDGVGGIFLRYDTNANKLYLRNDANTGWLGGAAPGTNRVIENGWCKLYAAEVTGSRSGSVRTVNWRIELKSGVPGRTVGAWLYATDDTGLIDGWDRFATYSITGPNRAPVNVSLSPASGTLTVGRRFILTSTYSDPDGYNNLADVHLLINTAIIGSRCVYVRYDTNANRLYLANDAGTGWACGVTPGSSQAIVNSACVLYPAETTGSRSGSTRTVNWCLQIRPPMAWRNCKAWMYARDDGGLKDGWDPVGSFICR
jgi:hypothetical protein